MALDFLRDCTLVGPAFPEPFVRFELESELSKAGLLPKSVGAEGRLLQESWVVYRRKLRELVRGGSIRVRNHVIEPLVGRLGYARLEAAEVVETREGAEEGGDLLVTEDGSARLRVWCTEFDEDLEAPSRRGAAYRYSHIRIAQRVLLACGERLGLVTNGTELRILISDPARPDSQIVVHIDPAWKDKRSYEAPDSYRLLVALATPNGVSAIADLVDKARLQQTRVTKELRKQARTAVEGFLQEVLDNPENQARLLELKQRPDLARELWREALIVVYRLLFILKLEATDDPARSFSFASTSLWRNTFSPSVALPRFVRALLDHGSPTGRLLEDAVRGLFRMFVEGLDCTELHVKPLGGTLFGEKVTPLLSDHELHWGERGVALLLDQLLWTSPKRSSESRERVHYGSLGVEDLGRVYEALLELEPGIAAEPMCRLRRAKLEVVVPISQGEKYRPADATPVAEADPEEEAEEEIEEEEAEEPTRGRKSNVEWIEEIPPGHFYLRVGLGRKSTGSYYTPHSFVRFLVQETLGPLVNDRSPKDDPRPAEILKLKVLDPAMGSGHFLVEACRFLGARLYEAARLCDERLAQFERTAAAAQNEELKTLDEAQDKDYRQRLQLFLPPDAELLAYLPSRSPEASESGLSQKRAEAICRRLVAIHCLYGVDKNPLAVELAKVSLWIESHSEGLPLTFLDHRLVLGDSITGPFLHHLLTYPGSKRPVEDLYTQRLPEKLKVTLTEAIALVRDIEGTLGATVGDVEVKATMRRKLEAALAPFKVVAAAWAGGVMLGPDGCDDEGYKWLLNIVAESGQLPSDLTNQPRVLDMIAQGLGLQSVLVDSKSLTDRPNTEEAIPAFPYDLSFPEVFFRTAEVGARTGFDAVLGNPPWDTVTGKEKEWFSSYDFSVLDAASKPEREAIQERILGDPARAEAFGSYIHGFECRKRIFDALYRYQKVSVEGDLAGRFLDLFRVFMERNVQLLGPHARTGVVVPSAFHANEGATGIRRLYLREMELQLCYSFENKRKLFEIHRSFKFAVIVAEAGKTTAMISCAFYLHDDEWLFAETTGRPKLSYSVDFISKTGGEYLSFPEIKQQTDAEICQTCYSNGELVKPYCSRSGITVAVELNKTKDNWRFRSIDDSNDYRCPEEHSRLVANGDLLLVEGKTFWQFDDRWGDPPRDSVPIGNLRDKPNFLRAARYYRFGFRDISSSTNERTAVFAMFPPGVVFAHSVLAPERAPFSRPNSKALTVVGIANSFTFDFLARLKAGSHLSLFMFESLPFPEIPEAFVAHGSLRLSCNHSGYAKLWSEQLGTEWREDGNEAAIWPVLASKEQRWRVRAAIDAMVANCYGLSRDQYSHILSTFHHTDWPGAPSLCLLMFDEAAREGTEKFAKKYDPYWDVPPNENLPQPVIDIPLPVAEPELQRALPLTASDAAANIARPRRSSRASGGNSMDQVQFERAKQLLLERREIASSDVQSTFGLDAAHARILLKQLVEDGVAAVEGSGRATRYVARPGAAHGHITE